MGNRARLRGLALCAVQFGCRQFFSMNAFEPLFWMGCVYLLVRIINGGSPTFGFGSAFWDSVSKTNIPRRSWLRHFIALLLTPERRHFAEKWIWFGGLIAFASPAEHFITSATSLAHMSY